MGDASIVDHLVSVLLVIMTFTLPPLLVAMIAGLTVSVLQAATQIQDQTLPQTVKLVAVVLTLAMYGTTLAAPLVRYTEQVFSEFPALTR
ncbi:EscS/YscS/HrcS family type III secretion system export apparatus protein [Bradyrhizobium sp. USDA 4353]